MTDNEKRVRWLAMQLNDRGYCIAIYPRLRMVAISGKPRQFWRDALPELSAMYAESQRA